MNEQAGSVSGWQEPRMPRVVPEVLDGITAPERRAGLEAAMAAWWRVTSRLAAPVVDAGRLAAVLELGGLAGRAWCGYGGCGRRMERRH